MCDTETLAYCQKLKDNDILKRTCKIKMLA